MLGAFTIAFSSIFVRLSHASPSTAAIFRCAYAVPVLGLLANIVMLVTILGVGIIGGGDSQTESLIALGFAAAWAVVSGVYIAVSNRRSGRSLMAQPKAVA